MTEINASVVKWARERTGWDIEIAASKLGFKDSMRKSAIEKLLEFENGSAQPSWANILKMSQRYKVPLGIFFLDKIPEEEVKKIQFRVSTGEFSNDDRFNLDNAINDFLLVQDIIGDLLQSDGEVPYELAGSISSSKKPIESAAEMNSILEFDKKHFRSLKDSDALKYLVGLCDRMRIFVFFGELAQVNLDSNVYRGIALYDDYAPLIVINNNQSIKGKIFTLIHEIAHILLGESVVNNPNEIDVEEERFCNQTASEFLLSGNEIASIDTNSQNIRASIASLSKDTKISRPAISYRLFQMGVISKDFWQVLRSEYDAEWREYKKAKKDQQSSKETSPSYYTVRQSKFSKGLIRYVRASLDKGTISYTTAGKIFKVAPNGVYPLIKASRV